MKLRDNKWGFDLSLDNPFRIFRVLRQIADDSVGVENVSDLSRGDPGYGFSPSVDGRRFYNFLLEMDTLLNNPDEHFVTDNREDFESLWGRIQQHARTFYSEKTSEKLLEDFYFFLTRIEKYAEEQGLNWTKRDVIFEMYKYSALSGGSYLDPKGETLSRVVIADHYNKKFDLKIDYNDLLLLNGVSHGIGTIFEFLCDEKIGYLKKGDYVLLNSPVYAPYNTILNNRGLKTYTVPINPITGEVDGDLDEILSKAPKNLKMVCLIDPNNPTGFMNNEIFMKKISKFAKERDILIVSDEVYSDFFFARKKSITNYASKHSIVINGRSKIERSTGLRFGEYIITKDAQKHITENILKGKIGAAPDLMTALVFAKAPGGIDGEFQHVTFVPGPSQYLGISHIIFGEDDREEYLKRIRVNMECFYEILGLDYKKNLYYTCFDLMDVPGNTKEGVEPEELFVGLAKRGVVLVPANLFFSEADRKNKDYKTYARGSLPNATFGNLQKAAKTIKEYMTG